MITVAAVVVTRNRLELLKRCFAAIDSQTYPIRELVVVDNASDEPTRELLAGEAARRGPSFHSVRLEENVGGAGGFHEGMRACLSLPCTHMWLMDDDCEPEPDAMAELVAAAAIVGENAVLGSNVFDLNGENINVQAIGQRPGMNGMPQYARHLADGLIEMMTLTFVSFLISVDSVRQAGLPLKEFFIWVDDTEYSLRLARYTKLYQVGKSKTKHLKSGDASQRIFVEEDPGKIAQYHWLYRNRLFVILKYDGIISINTLQFVYRSCRDMIFSIQSGKFALAKCRTIAYGLWSGIVFARSMPKKEKLGLLDREIVSAALATRDLFNGSAAGRRMGE